MRISRVYFILTVMANAIFWLIAAVGRGGIFSLPFGYIPGGVTTLSRMIFVFVELSLLFFAVFSLIWGLWLLFRKSIRNWLVVVGIIMSVVVLVYVGIIIYQQINKKCEPSEAGSCILINPLR